VQLKGWLPQKWDKETDVVVIGYGGAGAVTAITAFDAGTRVLVLEKTPSLASLGITHGDTPATQISGGGGNTHISSGDAASPINLGCYWVEGSHIRVYVFPDKVEIQGAIPRQVLETSTQDQLADASIISSARGQGDRVNANTIKVASIPG